MEAAQVSPSSVARSGSLPIRAPVSAEEGDPNVVVSSSEGSAEDEGFETASDPDDEPVGPTNAKAAGMPIAKVSGDDDVDGEEEFEEEAAVEEGEEEEEEGNGDGVARVPTQNPSEYNLENAAEDGVVGDGNSGDSVEVEKDLEVAEESKPVEAVEVEKDLEVAEESKPVDTTEKKDGASDDSVEKGGEDAVELKPVEEDGASDCSKLEVGVIESKPEEASDMARPEEDGDVNSIPSNEINKEQAGSEPVEPQEPNLAKDEEIEAADVAQSQQDHDEVTASATENLELEFNDSKAKNGGVESEENVGGDSASLKAKVSEDSKDKINGSEAEKEEGSNEDAVNESKATPTMQLRVQRQLNKLQFVWLWKPRRLERSQLQKAAN